MVSTEAPLPPAQYLQENGVEVPTAAFLAYDRARSTTAFLMEDLTAKGLVAGDQVQGGRGDGRPPDRESYRQVMTQIGRLNGILSAYLTR